MRDIAAAATPIGELALRWAVPIWAVRHIRAAIAS
jgi:hypothetical protein